MPNFIKEYFGISPSARRAIWILIVLIILIFIFPYFYNSAIKPDVKPIDESTFAAFDSVIKLLHNVDTTCFKKPVRPFDPNRFTTKEWIELGVKERIAQSILKYINKGGKFRKKEDLMKIYGFDTLVFQRISPFIHMTEPVKRCDKTPVKRKYIEIQKVDINSADTVALDKLPGIGKILAGRIIKYRNLLGGFYSAEQLKEVYGLKVETIKRIITKINIDTGSIVKMNLNTISENELLKHPYVGRYKAKAIIRYRNYTGKINSSMELLKNDILTDNEYLNLKVYFKQPSDNY
jgi:competence protein ComEA